VSGRYVLILVLYALASFAVILVVSEAIVSLLRNRLLQCITRMRSKDAVLALLALRWLPAVVAFLLTFVCALPGYLRGEPVGTAELPGFALVVLALCGLSALVIPTFRSVRVVRRTKATTQGWLAEMVATEYFAEMPVVELGTEVPLVVAVGLMHKRIFLSAVIRKLLSARELRAVLRHEAAHCRQHHNLARLFFSMAPKTFSLRWLHEALNEAMEFAADDAVRDVPGDALNLAAAVVLLARENSHEVGVLFSMATGVNSTAALERRVERLVLPRPTLSDRMMARMACGFAGFLALTVGLGSLHAAQAAFRETLELLVR
jgi:Zn-dependent protease with chaperone function